MNVKFIVYRREYDSMISYPQLPIGVFDHENDAIEFAKKQPGYGYEVDWFVKAIPHNPS